MKKRILPYLVGGVLLVAAFLAFYKNTGTKHPAARPPENSENTNLIRITFTQGIENLLYLGLYVAQDAYFFEKAGLDVTIKTGFGDVPTFASLTAGSSQFIQSDPAFAAIGKQQGFDARLIGTAVDRVALWGVTFNKSLKPFSDPAGFKGKTVTTFPSPSTCYSIQKQLVTKAGLKLGSDTKILEAAFGTELASIKNVRSDIALTLEPNVALVEKEGGHIVYSYPESWGPFTFTGVMTSKKFIDESPDVVQRFANAYEAALRCISTNSDLALEVAYKRFPSTPREVIAKAVRRLTDSGSIPAHLEVNPESWRKCLETRLDVGDLKAIPDTELIDNSFARRARGQ